MRDELGRVISSLERHDHPVRMSLTHTYDRLRLTDLPRAAHINAEQVSIRTRASVKASRYFIHCWFLLQRHMSTVLIHHPELANHPYSRGYMKRNLNILAFSKNLSETLTFIWHPEGNGKIEIQCTVWKPHHFGKVLLHHLWVMQFPCQHASTYWPGDVFTYQCVQQLWMINIVWETHKTKEWAVFHVLQK